MSRQVDQRVVEMQFDNRQFEDNVQTSISTLDKLKKALRLEDAAEGFSALEKAASKVDVSGAEESLENLGQKFQWLEKIASGACFRIGGMITDTLTRAFKSLTIDNFTAGFKKYGEKTENVATIMAATGKSVDDVNEQLEKLMWYTDETSYNFTDMASNIGKFTNNGVALEDAVTAMMGIGNWAGVSGANIQEASRAMYNLSQAMSVGEVKLMDWRSIQNANMATMEFKQQAIDAAVAVGQLKKAGDGLYETLAGNTGDINIMFSEFLKDGWFSADVLMDTLKKYGDYTEAVYKNSDAFDTCAEAMANTSAEGMELGEKAFKAAQEARTFGQAIDATKDAVSSAFMQTFEIIFGNYEEAKTLWTQLSMDLWDVFAGPIQSFNSVLGPAFGKQWEDVGDKILETGVNAEDFEKRLAEAARAAGLDVDGLINKYGSLTKSLKSGWLDSGKLGKILDDILGDTERSTVKTAASIVNLEEVVNDVIKGKYANNWSEANREREKLLTEAGYNAELVQDLVNKVMWGEDVDFNVVMEDQLESLGYTEEQIESIKKLREELKNEDSDISKLIKGVSGLGDEFAAVADMSGRDLLFGSITNILQTIQGLVQAITGAFRDIFPAAESNAIWEGLARIYLLTQKIHDFFAVGITKDGEEATSIFEKLQRIIRVVFVPIDIVAQAVKALLSGAIQLISFFMPAAKTGVGGLLDLAGGVADFIVKIDEFLKKNEVFKKVVSAVVTAITTVFGKLFKIIGKVYDAITGTVDGASSSIGSLSDLFSRAFGFLGRVFENFRKSFTDAFKGFDETFNLDLKPVTDALSRFADVLADVFGKIVSVLFGDGSKISEKVGSVFGSIGSAFGNIAGSFSNITSNVGPAIAGVIDSVTSGLSSLGDGTSSIKDKVSGFIDGIKGLFKKSNVSKSVEEEVAPAFEETAVAAEESTERVEKSFGGIGGSAKGLYHSAVSPVVGLKGAIGANMKGITGDLGGASKALDSFGAKASETAKSVSKTTGAKELFIPMAKGIKSAIQEGADELRNGNGSVTDAVQDTVDNITEQFKGADIFGALRTAIKNGIAKLAGSNNTVISSIGKGLESASAKISEFGSKVAGAFSNFPGLAKGLSVFGKAVKIMIGIVTAGIGGAALVIKLLVDSFKGLVSTIVETFTTWKNQNEVSLRPIISSLEKVRDKVKEFFSGLESSVENGSFGEKMAKVFAKLSEILRGFLDIMLSVYKAVAPKIKGLFSTISDAFKEAIKSFSEASHGQAFESAAEGMEAIFGGAAFLALRKFLKSLKKDSRSLTQALKGLMDNIGGAFDGLTGALKGMQHELNARAIKNIGEAVLFLAIGVAAISLAATKGDVEKAAAIIAILTAELGGMMALLNAFSNNGNAISFSKDKGLKAYKDASDSIVKLAAGVLIMALAVAALAKINKPDLDKGLEAMTVIMLEITGSIAVLQATAGTFSIDKDQKTQKISKTVIAMAIALLAMIKVVKKLGTMDPDQLHQGLEAMTAIMIELTGMFVVIGTTEGQASKAGKGVKAIGKALLLLAVSMKIIASMNGDQFNQAMIGISAGILMMGGALAVLSKDGKGAYLAGKALQTVSIGLIALAVAVKILSTIGLEGTIVAIGGMAVALMAIVGVAAIVKGAGLAKSLFTLGAAFALIGVGCIGLGAGLLAVVEALILLGTAGAVAVKGIELLGDALIALVKSWTQGILEYIIESAPMIGEAVVAMLKGVAIALSGSVTEFIDPLIGALVQLIDVLKADNRIYDIITGLVDICVQIITAVFDGLAAAAPRLVKSFVNLLNQLGIAIGQAFGEFKFEDVLMGSLGIGVLVAAMKVLASLKPDIKSALMVAGALVLIAGAFTGLFFLLNMLDGENILVQTTAMSEVMLSMAVILKLLEGMDATAALESVKALDIMLANFVGVLAIFAGIEHFVPGLGEFLNSGGKIFTDLCGILGECVGAIIGGFAKGLSDGLPGIGTNISNFFKNISPGLELMANVKSRTFRGVKWIADAMLAFTASEVLDGIGRFIGGKADFVDFGKQLKKFAPYVVSYSKTIQEGGLDNGAIEKSATAGKILAEFAKAVPKRDGAWQKLTGTTNLPQFGAQLQGFAPFLVNYAKMTKDITGDMVEGSVNAATMLADLATKIPDTGGLKKSILGESDLSDFGQNLKVLGRGLLSYAANVSGIDNAKVTASTTALTMLAGLYSFVPPTGGLLPILGEADLEDFASQLEGLAEGLTKYSNGIAGVDADAVAESATGLSALVSIGQAFANSDTGYFDLGDYGEKINALGIYYAEFYKSVSRTVKNKILDAIDVLDSLGTVATSQNGTSLEKLSTALYNLSQVTLDSFAESFETAGETIRKTGGSIVTDLVAGFTDGATSSLNLSLVKGSGASIIDEFEKGLEIRPDELAALAVGLVSGFTSAVKNQQGLMTGAATILAEKFVSGISSGTVKLNAAGACGELVTTMKNQFYTHTDDFETIGSDIVNGLVRGMRNNAWKVRDAAEDLGATAEKGTKSKKGVDSHSPSKKFIKIGLYCVQGFVKGIVDNTKMIENTVKTTFGKRLIKIAQAQVNTFAKVYKSNKVKKTMTEAERSLRTLGTELYHQSDAYKENKKQIKDYTKELSKLQKEQKKYTKGSKDYKNAEKQIKEAQKNLKNAQKQAIKDSMQVFNDYYNGIKDQAKEFIDIFSSNVDSQIDLFSKFEKGERITSKNIIRNMRSQIDGVTEWKKNLTELGKRGIAEGLLKQLEEMGPSGSTHLKAFLKMSNEQIKEANSLFRKQQAIANENLLADMKSKITDVKNWAANVSALAAKGLNKGILQKLIEMGPDGYEYVSAFMSMSAKEIKKLNKTYAQTLSVPKSVATEVVSAYAYAGTNAAKGFAKGLTKGKSSAINAAVKLANEALKAAKKRLGIKSPSREFAKVGDFAGQGFINALYSYAERSYEAGSTIADSAESGLNDAIQRITDIIAGNVDEQPTITPQLDLTNVYDGMGELDALFGGTNSIFATNSVRNARLAQTDISGSGQDAQMSGTGNTVYNFNQYNSSPKALSRLDIYRQTRNQFAMMKGVANA